MSAADCLACKVVADKLAPDRAGLLFYMVCAIDLHEGTKRETLLCPAHVALMQRVSDTLRNGLQKAGL